MATVFCHSPARNRRATLRRRKPPPASERHCASTNGSGQRVFSRRARWPRDAVSGGKVKINGAATKPAREVKVGDRLEISNSETRWEISVRALSDKRGPAPEARLLYEESPESITAREACSGKPASWS
jgi:ribosomal 50S subunit-recycling heat shock protein